MLKIHPGFTALAILMGPASIIIGHQKVTEYFQHDIAARTDTASLVQQVYAGCSETSQSQRASQCREYMGRFEQCVALKERCDPRSMYANLVRLNLSPWPQETSRINKIAVTED